VHISVVITFDLPRKRRELTQKANVSHVKAKMDKMVRRRELPCVRRFRSFHRVRVVRGMALMTMERKKKSEEEAKE
jgi:hypothetical protein